MAISETGEGCQQWDMALLSTGIENSDEKEVYHARQE
jgi:hypothetical protein